MPKLNNLNASYLCFPVILVRITILQFVAVGHKKVCDSAVKKASRSALYFTAFGLLKKQAESEFESLHDEACR
jgi:hypothetical protein